MKLSESTALVTGTNRGMGHHFAAELVRRGAKVYATARRPELIDVPGAQTLALDITDPESVAAAAAAAGDVDLLINNAASTGGGNLVTGDLDAIRDVMESNYFGTLAMVRAFAPILGANGGGAILNVLSAVAWNTVDGNTAYSAAKSAEWGLTNGVRVELAGQGTQVAAMVPGLIATQTLLDFADDAGFELPADKLNDPAELVGETLDELEAGSIEILDGLGAEAKASLAGPPQALSLLG
jgi:NAD(P)-dependent dehydrogenase (short-subunit alcohol dehydrogenase family)